MIFCLLRGRGRGRREFIILRVRKRLISGGVVEQNLTTIRAITKTLSTDFATLTEVRERERESKLIRLFFVLGPHRKRVISSGTRPCHDTRDYENSVSRPRYRQRRVDSPRRVFEATFG